MFRILSSYLGPVPTSRQMKVASQADGGGDDDNGEWAWVKFAGFAVRFDNERLSLAKAAIGMGMCSCTGVTL